MHTQFGKTIVGYSATDTAPSSLAFAHWWSEKTGAPRPTIVHVAPALLQGDDAHYTDLIRRRAHEPALAVGRASFPLEVVHSAHTEAALVDAFKRYHADFLVLRRRAPRRLVPWIALGSFTRTLLHHAPCSMVVVPTDWVPPQEPGPVVALVTPDDGSRRLLEVASTASKALGVELVVAHAIADPQEHVGPYYTGPQIETMRAETREKEQREMSAFLDTTTLPERTRIVDRLGDVRAFAQDLAIAEKPSIVLLSTHQRPLRERLLTPSVRTDIAAHLPAPVALVTPRSGD